MDDVRGMTPTTELAIVIMDVHPTMPLVHAVRLAGKMIALGYTKVPF